MEIRKISADQVFKGKSQIQPILDAAVANQGEWLEFDHKSANMVGRLRKHGLEAQGQRNEAKTLSTIQYRLAVGASLVTPPKVVQVRKPKAVGAKAKK